MTSPFETLNLNETIRLRRAVELLQLQVAQARARAAEDAIDRALTSNFDELGPA